MMIDPNQNPAKKQEEINEVKEPNSADGTNWEENHRIDEEGNELDPEDIK